MGTMQLEDDVKRDLDDSGCVQDEPFIMKGGCGSARAELLDLSDDVLLYILRHCAPRDLKALGFSCSRLASLVLERSLWRDVDARGEPCGRFRLKWLLSHALHADTNRLMISGFARQAKGCLGQENGRRPGPWRGAEQDKEESGPSGECPNAARRRRRIKCSNSLHQLPRFSGALSWPDNPEDEEYEILAEEPFETPGQLCFGPRFTLNATLMKELMNKCPKLSVLALEYCNINCKTTAISQFPQTLVKLSLRGSKCYNVPMDKSFLYKIQDHLPNLEDVNVSECDWLEPSSLLPLSKLKALQRLEARSAARLSEFVAYASLATRYGFRNLEELDLRGCPVGDSEVSALGWLPALKILRLQASTRGNPMATHRHSTAIPTAREVLLDYWEVQEPDFFKNRLQSESEPMDCSVKTEAEGSDAMDAASGETSKKRESDNIIDQDETKGNITTDFKGSRSPVKRKPGAEDDKPSSSKRKKGSEDGIEEGEKKFVNLESNEQAAKNNGEEFNDQINEDIAQDNSEKFKEGRQGEIESNKDLDNGQASDKPGSSSKKSGKTSDNCQKSKKKHRGEPESCGNCEEFVITESNVQESYDIEMEGGNECDCMESEERENEELVGQNSSKERENEEFVGQRNDVNYFDKYNDGVRGNMEDFEESERESQRNNAEEISKGEDKGPQEEMPSTSGNSSKGEEKLDDNDGSERNIKDFVENFKCNDGSQDENKICEQTAKGKDKSDNSKGSDGQSKDKNSDNQGHCSKQEPDESSQGSERKDVKGERWVRNVENPENQGETSGSSKQDEDSKKWGSNIVVTRYFDESNNNKEGENDQGPSKQGNENDGNSNRNGDGNDSDSSDDSPHRRFHPDGVCISVIRKSGNLSLHVNPGDRIRVTRDGVRRLTDEERSNEEEAGRFRGFICFRRGNNEPEVASLPDDPQYRALYFNFGQPHQVMYGYGHPMSFVTDRFGMAGGPVPDPALLVSDASIRRFGRADGERINYVMVGPLGPNLDQFSRPERSSLEELSLQGYRHVTDRSLTHLTSAAPNLRRLDVRGSGVTEQGVERFRALRPDCEVLFGEMPPVIEEEP